MKSNVFIIHGSYGGPEDNWIPWLKSELEKLGIEVIAPLFPTPEGQSLDSWNQVFKPFGEKINSKSIFIGHSLGPAFILNLLEKVDVKITASFFVAPFVSLLGNPDFDTINSTFFKQNFDWGKIKSHCNNFNVFYSDNDPYVPKAMSEFVAEKTSAHKFLINNAGHFNTKAGYLKFEELWEKLEPLLDK